MSDLHAALVAALADLTVVEKGNTAKIPTKDGGSYSYSYADLPDVVRLTRPALAAHGLVVLTPIVEGPAVKVLIVHQSGETLDLGSFPFPAGRDAQATGSAVTYHRRYALLAALGIAADDDDDGHAATQAARRPERPVETVPASVADEWLERLNQITDGRTRTAVKNRFGKQFGQPHGVHPDQVAEVDAWIDAELARIAEPPNLDASEAPF